MAYMGRRNFQAVTADPTTWPNQQAPGVPVSFRDQLLNNNLALKTQRLSDQEARDAVRRAAIATAATKTAIATDAGAAKASFYNSLVNNFTPSTKTQIYGVDKEDWGPNSGAMPADKPLPEDAQPVGDMGDLSQMSQEDLDNTVFTNRNVPVPAAKSYDNPDDLKAAIAEGNAAGADTRSLQTQLKTLTAKTQGKSSIKDYNAARATVEQFGGEYDDSLSPTQNLENLHNDNPGRSQDILQYANGLYTKAPKEKGPKVSAEQALEKLTSLQGQKAKLEGMVGDQYDRERQLIDGQITYYKQYVDPAFLREPGASDRQFRDQAEAAGRIAPAPDRGKITMDKVAQYMREFNGNKASAMQAAISDGWDVNL